MVGTDDSKFRKLPIQYVRTVPLRSKVVGDELPLGHHRSLRSRGSLGSISDSDRFRVSNPRNQARCPSH